MRISRLAMFIPLAAILSAAAVAQFQDFTPVTDEMLRNPAPGDWLMFSRTYDAQRFSPLDQINKQNAGSLTEVWRHVMGPGVTETIPTVYNGVMYVTAPGAIIQALDATNGELIWEYNREYDNPNVGTGARSKTLAIFEDMIYFASPDSHVVALNAVTGELRWEARTDNRGHTGGPIVVEGKVLNGGTCTGGLRANCYISAHDARTGQELWRFYTVAGPDDPVGDASWGGAPVETRRASTWGLPGSYDAVRRLVYWGIANPTPNTRRDRHGGNPFAIPTAAPADLYSNSTVALNPDSGKLEWYYQHLPGDDWDQDMNQERILLRTAFNPDPRLVKWINPDIPRGEVRDVVVNVGEGGGLWVLDSATGQFLWAIPFPYDVPNFILADIDVRTGTTYINEDLFVDEPGERHVICSFNTKSYWPMAYHPGKNSLYIPFIDNCLDMTSAAPATGDEPAIRERRVGTLRDGVDPDTVNGLAKIHMETGEIQRFHLNPVPTTGAVVVTAGDVFFWGDLNNKFRAFDADTGEILWESTLGGPVSVSTITYAVNGKQYVAVISGYNLAQTGLIRGTMGPVPVDIELTTDHNAIYVFALPD